MPNPMIRIHNITTDEVIDREMNAAEFKQYEVDKIANAARQAITEAAITQKAALLARLGITADEAKLLIG